jgi:lipoate-protein ligase A
LSDGGVVWRIIRSEPADGAWNMAVDEALLEAALAGGPGSGPTLRFYTWQPPCLSLGYFQQAARSANVEELARRGYTLVRRPTGGRGVLHADELTYSIVAPVGLLAAYDGPSVTGTYLAISRGLAEGLRLAGVPCEIASGRRHARTTAEARLASAACFDAPSSYELTAGGRKIVGSAQTRRGGVLLQHGSIPMTMDHATAAAVMGLPEGSGAEMLARSVATVKEFAPECTVEDLAAALMEGLRRHLMPQARPGVLTPEEVERAESLRLKYLSDEWNFMR